MISQRLVQLIESHADEISRRWLKAVRQHPDTLSYHNFPEDRLLERAYDVYSHLGRWVESDVNREHIEETYTKLGAERFREGFHLSEVVKALILTKRHLWFFILDQGFFDSVTELYQVLELYNSVILFFDRAVHFTVKGFEREASLYRKLPS